MVETAGRDAMLSVIIATRNSERALVRTLAPLVPGAASGLVREVIVTDAGSQDDTAAVADVAGCEFIAAQGPLGERLRAAAAAARAPWLLFLQPGIVLEPAWTGEAAHFIETAANANQAAAFRPALGARSMLAEAASLAAAALGGRPRPEQGLFIAKTFYDALGGHTDDGDAEAGLLRRIGRRRLSLLACRAAIVR
jgi:glycosyltransferase involved in cell wall biosynthesis